MKLQNSFTACFLFSLLLTTALFAADKVDPSTPKDSFTENYHAALAAFYQGDWATAQTDAEAAAKSKPDDAKTQLLLARISIEEKNFSAAETEAKQALKNDPQLLTAYECLGDLYLLQKNDAAARDAYLHFLEQKPKQPDVTLKLIYCEIGRGDFVAAGKELLELDPSDDMHPSYYFAKAAIAQASDKSEEARKNLEMARTMYGNQTWAEYMKLYLHLFSQ